MSDITTLADTSSASSKWGVLRVLDQQANHKLYICDEVLRVVDEVIL